MQAPKTFTFILPILIASISVAFACPAGFSKEADILPPVYCVTEEKGVTCGGEYIGQGFGNLSGGIQPGVAYEGLLKLILQIDLQEFVDWGGASIQVSSLYPHGNGLSEQYTGDFNILSNIDAYNSFRLYELWFQQKFLCNEASIRLGQMSADLEFFQSQWSSVFINSCFGTLPTISMGTNLPIYPVGGLGARIDFHAICGTFVRAAAYDSNPGEASTNDKNGTLFHLDPSAGVIAIAEAGYQVAPSIDNKGKEESYLVGAYYDSRRFTGDFVVPTHHSNGGLYAIVDRLFFRTTPYVDEQSKITGIGAFSRFAVAPADRNQVSLYADCGINYNGLWGRDGDVFGLALSYTKISSDYLVNNIPVQSGHETVLEATYRIQITERLSIQPDFQYIFNPGAFQHRPNAVVAGVQYDVKF